MVKQKSKQGQRHVLFVIIIALLTAISIFGLSFRVLLLPPITKVVADNTVNSNLSELTHAELVKVAEMGRAYVAGDKGATMPEGDDETTAFPPDVVSHMNDVRNVIHASLVFTIVIVVLLLATLIFTGIKAGKRTIANGVIGGGVTAVTLALLLTVIGFVSFDTLFTRMHELFFADGSWTFAEDSLLICTYPLAFWIGMALVWAFVLAVVCFIVSIIGFALRRNTRRRSTRRRNTRSELRNVG